MTAPPQRYFILSPADQDAIRMEKEIIAKDKLLAEEQRASRRPVASTTAENVVAVDTLAPTNAPEPTKPPLPDALQTIVNDIAERALKDCNNLQDMIITLAKDLGRYTNSPHSIDRSEDIFRHYPAMVLFLDAVRLAASLHPQHNECWHHWWWTFQNRVKDTVVARMGRFGGPKTDGQLYIAAGFSEYATRHQRGQHWRAGWYPQNHVTLAAKHHCVNFTMFFVSYFDEDIYLVLKDDIGRRSELRSFLQDFPNFFFLHYSPAMVMPNGIGASALGERDPFYQDRGAKQRWYTMFPRMIPIPHAPTDRESIQSLMTRRDVWPPKPYTSRKNQVAWRGATTGLERPYSRSDRARVVSQFAVNGRPKYDWADVAFSGLCQGVTQHELPMFGGRMEVGQLMNYRVHLDIDGNSNSWDGLRWRLMFGMVVVKARSSSGFTQWYYRHLENGVNIIESPVDGVAMAAQKILEDVPLAEKISANAKAFGEQHLSYPALDRAVTEAVRDAWKLGYDDQTKWCVSPC
ncbi:Hypothetical protein, putative [Bodo saltans]|uniref:Glycosyl transferase CAP10 domain-containing protein n=1 Tax=Bodo saltans TaxID=75058 RepID=A0A0S4JG26_BODSA|nr:Hypothetical protein, putative [Bodo saltans]|eukprot:CUG88151.1 Hypothetical protein, putative [Bodo saltans]